MKHTKSMHLKVQPKYHPKGGGGTYSTISVKTRSSFPEDFPFLFSARFFFVSELKRRNVVRGVFCRERAGRPRKHAPRTTHKIPRTYVDVVSEGAVPQRIPVRRRLAEKLHIRLDQAGARFGHFLLRRLLLLLLPRPGRHGDAHTRTLVSWPARQMQKTRTRTSLDGSCLTGERCVAVPATTEKTSVQWSAVSRSRCGRC